MKQRNRRKSPSTKQALCLSLCCVLVSLTACGSSGGKMKSGGTHSVGGYALETVASFAHQANISLNEMMTLSNGDGYQIITCAGEVSGETYLTLEELGDGYYVVRDSAIDTDINSAGLVSIEGDTLIPCEAAIIDYLPTQSGENGRYLSVTYATGTTTDKDECFFYLTQSAITALSNGDAEGDVWYTGYARIYDLQERRFVPNVEIDYLIDGCCYTCGDSFTIRGEDGVTYLYDADGNAILKTEKSCQVGNGYLIISANGKYGVYDEEGTGTYGSEHILSVLESTSGYLTQSTGNGSVVLIDIYGNKVLEDDYYYISSEYDGIVRATEGEKNTKRLLIDVDAGELASSEQQFDQITADYYYTSVDSNYDTYSIYCRDGLVIKNMDNDYFYRSNKKDLVLIKDNYAFVINDGDFSLSMANIYQTLSVGLVCAAGTSDGQTGYGVFDLFTGRQLLDYKYSSIQYVSGYIYALDNAQNTWTIYRVNLSL